MRKIIGCGLSSLLAGWILASPVMGQSESPETPSAPEMNEARQDLPALLKSASPTLAGVVDPNVYRVGAGDLIQVQMWGKASRSWVMEVGPEGVLLLPGSGALQVAGRTLVEVRKDVLGRLRSQFRDVSIEMRLARPRTFRVYLTGQTKRPGPVLANGASRVGDVLSPQGLLETASQRRIEIKRTDGTRDFADLDLFFRIGDASLNPWLRDGDIINIPVATDFIYAQGAVALPGRFELGPRDSLLTLFRLAGDPLPSADADRALLIRWKHPFEPESLWFGLGEAYDRKINPELREGDRLYVYFIPQYHLQHEASILGEVARPGVYPIFEGRHRLSNLVTAAGSFLNGADLSAIRVYRRNPATGEKDPELERLLRLSRDQLTSSEYEKLSTKLAGLREDYRVDWNRLTGSKDLDLLLRDGDIVRVERLVSSVRVDGEVRRPGIVAYRSGQGISDYVREAGGYTDRAWRSRVRVTRSVTGQTLLARNVKTLDPGDLVWIPEKPDRTVWDHSRDLITALAQIATVIIAIRSIK